MKTILLFIILALFCLSSKAKAQDSTANWKLHSELDIASRYIWRGSSFSKSPCFQPFVEFTKGGFFVNTWGSYTFAAEKFQEADISIGYNFKHATLMLSDYFSPIDTGATANTYFDYKRSSTRHNYDLQLSFNEIAGSQLCILFSTIIYGYEEYDYKSYSTYIELSYNAKTENYTIKPFLGLTPMDGYYASKFAFINCGMTIGKEIQISDRYKIPVKTSLVFNPDKQDVFLAVVLSL